MAIDTPSTPSTPPIKNTPPGGTTTDGPASPTPVGEGGGFQPQPQAPSRLGTQVGTVDDPDGGGEILAFADFDTFDEDPCAGGEISDIVGTAGFFENPDAGGEILAFADFDALEEDPCAGGEIADLSATAAFFAHPDDGGEVAMDGLNLLAQVTHLKAQDASANLGEIDPETNDKDHRDWTLSRTTPEDPDGGGEVNSDPDDGGEVFTRGGTLGIVEDPDGGGEVTDQSRVEGRTTVRDSHDRATNIDRASTDGANGDPDDGGEIGFGEGAMPPRPVTMTAADLGIVEDPDAGGEIYEDPDGGGEVTRLEQAPEADAEVLMIVDTFEPEPDLADFEVASDFTQAAHTFDPEPISD